MSQLVALGFDGLETADRVLSKLREMGTQHLIDLEDAVVVQRDAGGRVRLKQAVNMTGVGAGTGGLSGMFWGTLVGLLFLNPLAGMAVGGLAGAGAGALAGSLIDYGINDGFIRKLAETIPSESSALFVLIRSATEDRVLAELQPFRPRVLSTSLSAEDEARLVEALRAHA